ncbi:hypothetical protein [Plesiomonas shigelloides]|uniref:hypothetical protein n=1 Tax=Plesiomonas shigelloides TaxID=703 RepID=UPI0022457BAB|nr:hypothetical protein [Plesiomonas shigelloides]MCX2499469.1 hypothetical protein [Plesiomonas shigelloides]
MDFLYRGFNSKISLEQAITPKKPYGEFESGSQCGDSHVQCGDNDFVSGLSVINTIHSHEYGGNGDPTGGLSTTPYFNIALKYALANGRYQSGSIIQLSVKKLQDCNARIMRINDHINNPAIPEDDEHWIWYNGLSLPADSIIKIIPVTKEQSLYDLDCN